MGMVFCRGCGKEIHETAPTCPHCGAPQSAQSLSSTSLKSQTVAGLLCAFLGAFGAHRFYLGKIASGVLYLLFFWTGIPSFIAFIELIIIVFSSPQKWAAKYNNGQLMPPVNVFLKVLVLIVPVIFMTFIIGLLAAITIPQFSAYREKSYCVASKAELKTAYTCAQAFFVDNPTATNFSSVQLDACNSSTTSAIEIISGHPNNLIISSKHGGCKTTYYINSEGYISEELPYSSAQEPADSAPTAVPDQTSEMTVWSPSFDCTKASSNAELLICSSEELATADVALAQVYEAVMSRTDDKQALKQEQLAWLKNERDVCTDEDTMLKVYQERIEQLSTR